MEKILLLVILCILFILERVLSTSGPLKIFVIVPVYNVENYLHQCMDSIINQSFENLEMIHKDLKKQYKNKILMKIDYPKNPTVYIALKN